MERKRPSEGPDDDAPRGAPPPKKLKIADDAACVTVSGAPVASSDSASSLTLAHPMGQQMHPKEVNMSNRTCQTMVWIHEKKLTVETNARRQQRLLKEEKQGKESKREPPPEHNILCLGGGKAFVPPELWPTFLLKYAADVSNGVEMSFTEVEPSLDVVRRLALDFDHKRRDRFILFAEVLEHIVVIQRVVNLFFPTGDNTAYVLCRPDVLEPATATNNGPIYSSGYHLIWPKVLASGHNCRRVRAAWVEALEGAFEWSGAFHPGNPGFSTIVDNSIYVGGLRLFGSSKIELCKACKGHKSGWCFECREYNGKVNLGRKYMPTHVISNDGSARPLSAEEKAQMRILTERCTIRSRQTPRSDYIVPEGAPPAVEKTAAASKARARRVTDGKESKEGGTRRAKNPTYDCTSREWKAIDSFMQMRLPAPFRHLRITGITSTPKRNAFVIKTDSTWCQNLGANHHSQRTFWRAERYKRQIFQQCHCTCDKKRPSGLLCSEYNQGSDPRKAPIALSEELFAILFSQLSSLAPGPPRISLPPQRCEARREAPSLSALEGNEEEATRPQSLSLGPHGGEEKEQKQTGRGKKPSKYKPKMKPLPARRGRQRVGAEEELLGLNDLAPGMARVAGSFGPTLLEWAHGQLGGAGPCRVMSRRIEQ